MRASLMVAVASIAILVAVDASAAGAVRWTRDGGTLTGLSEGGVRFTVQAVDGGFAVEGTKDGFSKLFPVFKDEFHATDDLRRNEAGYEREVVVGALLKGPQQVAEMKEDPQALPITGEPVRESAVGEPIELAPPPAPVASSSVAPVAKMAMGAPVALSAPAVAPVSGSAPGVSLPVSGPAPASSPVAVAAVEAPVAVVDHPEDVQAAVGVDSPVAVASVPSKAPEAIDEALVVRDWEIKRGVNLEQLLIESAAKVGYSVRYDADEIPIDASAVVPADFFTFVDDVIGGLDITPRPSVHIRKRNRMVVVMPGGQ